MNNSSNGFGKAMFNLPAKAYKTKDGKSTMVARVEVPYGLLTFEATIWSRDVENKAEGTTDNELTVGLPRGVSFPADHAEAVNQWKLETLQAFDAWTATISATNDLKKLEAPRLVKAGAKVASTGPADVGKAPNKPQDAPKAAPAAK
jgi:hypothetical protein